MKPKVSVVIPTYNRAYILKRAIDSVLNQTETNLELIVVDDGSTDNTKEVVESYSDVRVRYIHGGENSGPGRARNIGAQKAQGDFVAFHDSDDEWMPEKLEKQLVVYEANPEAGMIYCSFIKYFPDKEVYFPPKDMPVEMKHGDVFGTLLFRPLIGTPMMFIPKSVWDEMGGFNENLRCFEDWELGMRIAKKYSILLIDEPLVKVYASEDSLILDSARAIEADFYMMRTNMEYYNTDELKKAKLDSIAARVRTLADFEAYKKGMKETMGVSF